jgi:hypothetical protein
MILILFDRFNFTGCGQDRRLFTEHGGAAVSQRDVLQGKATF